LQQALVVSQAVESHAVESVTTCVESTFVDSAVFTSPQETRKEATANIKRTFFIIFYFFISSYICKLKIEVYPKWKKN
jgi:hypothetical protein